MPDTVILIVEDDPNVRQTLRRMLTMNGFSVRVAPTASEAIDLARLERIDAVVLDLGLGSAMSGLHVLSWLRSQPNYVDVPIAIFTGRVELPNMKRNRSGVTARTCSINRDRIQSSSTT
jgi:DNA-binding response OmpR family regulator